jgi:hypothetical protein
MPISVKPSSPGPKSKDATKPAKRVAPSKTKPMTDQDQKGIMSSIGTKRTKRLPPAS